VFECNLYVITLPVQEDLVKASARVGNNDAPHGPWCQHALDNEVKPRLDRLEQKLPVSIVHIRYGALH